MHPFRKRKLSPSLARFAALFAVAALAACDADTNPTAVRTPSAARVAQAAEGDEGDGGPDIGKLSIMTYNIYQGTELQNSIAATTPFAFIVGVAQDFAMMHQTNFAERANAIAAEIDSARPDLVGMQEVALWRTAPHTSPATPATTVDQDFLAMLHAALRARGLHYATVSRVENFDVQGPGLFPTGLVDVRLTDSDVIIARTDEGDDEDAGRALSLSNPQSSNFATNLHITTAVGPVIVLEGWASIDVATRGGPVRFITTHLDAFAPPIRLAQANEILNGPANTSLPVILAGDLNTTSVTDTYAAISAAGFGDVWAELHPSEAGFTCCQALPAIVNPVSVLHERVDLMLVRGAVSPHRIQQVGATPGTRTPSGLWPSDHAGLVARFKIMKTD